MCDFSGRLIAWMDDELAESEAAAVERHVQACAECRDCVSAYEDASRSFSAYYTSGSQALQKPTPVRRIPLWIAAAAAVAAVAAMLAIAYLPRSARRVPPIQHVAANTPDAVSVPNSVVPSPKVTEPASPVVQTAAKRRVVAPRKSHAAEFAMAEPAIQIAIPADAMFPPGAVPEGVNYIANVSLGADGSVQGIRLQP